MTQNGGKMTQNRDDRVPATERASTMHRILGKMNVFGQLKLRQRVTDLEQQVKDLEQQLAHKEKELAEAKKVKYLKREKGEQYVSPTMKQIERLASDASSTTESFVFSFEEHLPKVKREKACVHPLKKGIFTRKKGVKVKQSDSKKPKWRGWFHRNNKASEANLMNDDESLEIFERFTVLGEAMKLCKRKGIQWSDDMYTDAGRYLKDLPVPRVTLDALKKTLEDSQHPVGLMIDDENKANDDKVVLFKTGYDLIWANKADLEWFGFKHVEEHTNVFKMKRNVRFVHEVFQAMLNGIFEDGDVHPKRNAYYKFKSYAAFLTEPMNIDTSTHNAATPHIMQTSIMQVEVEGVVHAGLLFEFNASQKYQKELLDIILRSYALFKYTESAMTVFTCDGTIVQQNPLSMRYLGMASAENVIYTDADENGKPVNRLRAFFGDSKNLYDGMWATINKNDCWTMTKMRVLEGDLKPFKKINPKLLSARLMETLDRGEASSLESSMWIYIQIFPMVDPSDGQKLIYMTFKDISKLVEQNDMLHEARKQEHEILQSIIPEHIIDHLIEEKRSQACISSSNLCKSQSSDYHYLSFTAIRDATEKRASGLAEHHSNVTILFTDVVGFTKMSSQCTPAQVMTMLNELFTLFDNITEDHNIYKVETIGDSYMCVAGLKLRCQLEKKDKQNDGEYIADDDPSCSHCQSMLSFAKSILDAVKRVKAPTDDPLQIRVGMHSGECMTGVVGYKMPRFCLFGDTVNTASRMESTGKPGYIHASKEACDLLPDEPWVATGGIEAKGKGMMETFLLKP